VAAFAYRASMALVRRGITDQVPTMVGSQYPPDAVGTAAVPRQPILPGVPQHQPPGAGQQPHHAPGAGPQQYQAPQYAPPGQEAASAPSMPASFGAIAAAFALVAFGGLVAYVMPRTNPFQISNAMTAYAALLVFAGAVERLLEPFSHWLPGTRARNVYEASIASMMNGDPASNLNTVARAKAALDRAIGNRAVVIWGIATAVSTIVAAASGFYLLRMVSASGWTPTISPWVDALVTGLVVGSGTKPLHDVITRVQSAGSDKG